MSSDVSLKDEPRLHISTHGCRVEVLRVRSNESLCRESFLSVTVHDIDDGAVIRTYSNIERF